MQRVFAAAAVAGACRLPGAFRLLGTTAAAEAAAAMRLEEQLQQAPWLQLLQVPGMGRGLFAAADIEQGTVVYEESPMLWTPSPHALHTTCNACLRPLPGSSADSSSSSRSSSSGLRFCSPGCSAAAEAGWAQAAAICDFGPLQQACREGGDKFPLMAAQLACLQVQQQARQEQQQQGLPPLQGDGQQQHQAPPAGTSTSGSASAGSSCSADGSSRSSAGQHTPHSSAAQLPAPPRGDALSQLRLLCYANIPQPLPEPWVHLHSLLLQGLAPLADSPQWGPACSSDWLSSQFSLHWFCDVMSRLHLNAFRVDTVPPLDLSDPSALLRAAAASLGGTAGTAAALAAAAASASAAPGRTGSSGGSPPPAGQHHTGSAAFLLASMLNHSCEPNLDISWPRNDSLARFTAARDIAANEQLTISYIDAEQSMGQRRAALQFAYGFACRCPRCQEEGGPAGAGGGARAGA